MKKELIAAVAILGLSASLVGCGNDQAEGNTSSEIVIESPALESEQPSEAPSETTETEEVTSEASDEVIATEDETAQKEELKEEPKTEVTSPSPSPTVKPSTSPSTKPQESTKPSTSKPQSSTKPNTNTTPSKPSPTPSTKPETNTPSVTPTPEVKPETSPETNPEVSSLSVNEIFSSITSGVELPSQMTIDDTLLQDLYGIDASLLDSYCAKMPMMSFHITEIGVFKVKDANNINTIVAGINKRANDVGRVLYPSLQETFDGRVVMTKGNYILFAMAEDSAKIGASFSNLIK